VKKIVVLGGAFFALGNVNPAAEANVSCRILFMFPAIRKGYRDLFLLDFFIGVL
jgi:hypothetical protein